MSSFVPILGPFHASTLFWHPIANRFSCWGVVKHSFIHSHPRLLLHCSKDYPPIFGTTIFMMVINVIFAMISVVVLVMVLIVVRVIFLRRMLVSVWSIVRMLWGLPVSRMFNLSLGEKWKHLGMVLNKQGPYTVIF